MANRLSRFNAFAIGSSGSIADYASKIAASGDFVRVEGADALILSWNNILLTPTRTYTFDPDYGCDLFKKVFDPADEQTAAEIESEVVDKLTQYDDRGKILSVDISFLSDLKGFNVNLEIEFNGISGEFSATFDEDLYFKFMEVSGGN